MNTNISKFKEKISCMNMMKLSIMFAMEMQF